MYILVLINILVVYVKYMFLIELSNILVYSIKYLLTHEYW